MIFDKRPSLEELINFYNSQLETPAESLSLEEMLNNPEKLFQFLRGEFQDRFEKQIRFTAIVPDNETDPEREIILINGSFRLIFDSQTHLAEIKNGEITITPNEIS